MTSYPTLSIPHLHPKKIEKKKNHVQIKKTKEKKSVLFPETKIEGLKMKVSDIKIPNFIQKNSK